MAGADIPAAPGLSVPEHSQGLKDRGELWDRTQQQAETPSSELEVGFIPSPPPQWFCRGCGMSFPRSRRRKAAFHRHRAPSQQDPATLQRRVMDPIARRLLRSVLGSFGMKRSV